MFTIIGVTLGLAGAAALNGFFKNFVVGVSPYDPRIFVSVALILTAVMTAACWLPAQRAARVDPTQALRE